MYGDGGDGDCGGDGVRMALAGALEVLLVVSLEVVIKWYSN